jgi:hypothetical protein
MGDCFAVMKTPSLKEITSLVKAIKATITDECQAFEFPDDDTPPGIQITIGCDLETGDWNYQTGDNSYTGGAYGYATWGVGYVFRRSNCREVARDILSDLESQVFLTP